MFMGDFEASKPWDVRGIEGIARFLGKVWRLLDELEERTMPAGEPNLRLRHRTIQAVTERIEAFKFNTAIAALMEYVSGLQTQASRTDLETLCLLLSPFAPHLVEEGWEKLGQPRFACTQAWPTYDPTLAVSENVTVAVQVNGKLRATFEAPRGTVDAELQRTALSLENVKKHMGDKAPRRIVVVKGALVNIVL
jgi:leucyl-tRNA synthetase